MAHTQKKGNTQGYRSVSRRLWLLLATYGTFAVGAAMALIPFIRSFEPSRRALAVGAPVDVDISKIQPGELKVVKWRGKPVWVLRRTDAMVHSLDLVTDLLADPQSSQSDQPSYATNEVRARTPEWLVMIAVCTHLGCAPLYRPEKGAEDLGADWQGGFFCPCHGSRFDLSGRVFEGMPAPTNMTVPEYAFVGDNTIRIGVSDAGDAA